MTVIPFDTMSPITPAEVKVEVASRPLPIAMRVRDLRSEVVSTVRQARPHLPSLPAAVGVPVVGVTALTTMLVRERRRAAG